jgi:hypothetical protein
LDKYKRETKTAGTHRCPAAWEFLKIDRQGADAIVCIEYGVGVLWPTSEEVL